MKVLQGNTDEVRIEGRILDPPIIARFIKVNVKKYRERPSLRVELYGCRDGMDILFVWLFCLYIYFSLTLVKDAVNIIIALLKKTDNYF